MPVVGARTLPGRRRWASPAPSRTSPQRHSLPDDPEAALEDFVGAAGPRPRDGGPAGRGQERSVQRFLEINGAPGYWLRAAPLGSVLPPPPQRALRRHRERRTRRRPPRRCRRELADDREPRSATRGSGSCSAEAAGDASGALADGLRRGLVDDKVRVFLPKKRAAANIGPPGLRHVLHIRHGDRHEPLFVWVHGVDSRPIVQCVVRRQGGPLTGRSVTLCLSAPLADNEDSCSADPTAARIRSAPSVFPLPETPPRRLLLSILSCYSWCPRARRRRGERPERCGQRRTGRWGPLDKTLYKDRRLGPVPDELRSPSAPIHRQRLGRRLRRRARVGGELGDRRRCRPDRRGRATGRPSGTARGAGLVQGLVEQAVGLRGVGGRLGERRAGRRARARRR